MEPTPVFLPIESCEQRSLADYSPRGHKESDPTECLTRGRSSHRSPLDGPQGPRSDSDSEADLYCPLFPRFASHLLNWRSASRCLP